MGTCIGRAAPERLVTSKGKTRRCVVMTGSAGTEGTSVIAMTGKRNCQKSLKGAVESAKAFGDRISVARAGIIAAEEGVSSMHDVTEGGCLEPYGNYEGFRRRGRN